MWLFSVRFQYVSVFIYALQKPSLSEQSQFSLVQQFFMNSLSVLENIFTFLYSTHEMYVL